MTISELLQYCMAKPGAEQSVHSDWKATQIKVEDVLFAMVKEVEGRPAASLKNQPGTGRVVTSAAQRCTTESAP
ncbi:Protein yjbR [Salmonella sp. NCTC 11881]|nr:Protein yjbR [Salmonella sp. NCTC 11881]